MQKVKVGGFSFLNGRCKNCGWTKKEHKKASKCPTKLVDAISGSPESKWDPWLEKDIQELEDK